MAGKNRKVYIAIAIVVIVLVVIGLGTYFGIKSKQSNTVNGVNAPNEQWTSLQNNDGMSSALINTSMGLKSKEDCMNICRNTPNCQASSFNYFNGLCKTFNNSQEKGDPSFVFSRPPRIVN